MIKNIVFDIGGVLIEFNPLRVLKSMKIKEDVAQKIVKEVILGPYWSALDAGIEPKEAVFEKMIDTVEEELKEPLRKFLNEKIKETVTCYDYSEGWIKGLREKGYKIFLLTNYPDWLFNYHFENEFTFTNLIDGKIVSGEVKLIKPDPAIYKTLLEKYGLKASECVFIDDRIENVEAARELGFSAIHFTNLKEVQAELENICR